ncbi:hypothetical protein F2S71_02000 [Pseudomonas syringae pv. actinidiae]|nr:hypothetical protein [Pseudomonas syringae pv. actinidiae]
MYDTPGLEDAIALLDYLERLDRPGERLDGPHGWRVFWKAAKHASASSRKPRSCASCSTRTQGCM